MKPVAFEFPFPPSVNKYWVHRRRATFISPEGEAFRWDVLKTVGGRFKKLSGRLRVTIVAYPPDKRCHDLDNLLKATLDAMKFAKVYDDDEQIDDLRVMRGEVRPDGALEVFIDPMEGASQ